ncbi:MAG: hypothetical protein D4R57_00020 [Verrucomicrobiales bacterium]|nr:MAG: hypothetical protein D4R57_00020 [Verrucomicrobiales bacterium]
MKTNQDVLHFQVVSPEIKHDSTKLVSLLALAAGAVAMPQTGNADIIYTDLGAGVAVGYGPGVFDYQVNIPGTASFKFERRQGSGHTNPGSLTYNYRTVRAGDFGPVTTPPVGVQGNAQGFAVPLNYDQPWNQGLAMFYKVNVGTASDLGAKTPSTSYDHKYLAWQFGDSTQGGATRYGWIEIGLQVNGYTAGGPLVTIYKYGWDNTGAKPNMGQMPVPEPSAMAMTVLSAMALGARGVRSWRQKRDAGSVV